MTAKGKAGESRDSSISSQFSIIINPMNVVKEAMVILPNMIKIFPIPDTKVNLAACFIMRRNPFMAEVQKFSEVKAI